MDFGRKIGRFDVGAGCENDRAFDHVFKLADVAGPSVLFEDIDGFFFEMQEGFAVFLGVLVEEVLGEERDIVGAFAECGDVDLDHIEPIVQVFAETALFDLLAQGFVGGGDQTDIDGGGKCATKAFDAAALEDTQEFDLDTGHDLADLVEEEGSAVSEFKSTGLCVVCAGECAFFVAKKLAIEQGFGKGGAVDGDKLLVVAVTESVEFACDQFFSCA